MQNMQTKYDMMTCIYLILNYIDYLNIKYSHKIRIFCIYNLNSHYGRLLMNFELIKKMPGKIIFSSSSICSVFLFNFYNILYD